MCWWTADLSSSNSVSAQNQQQVDQKLRSEVQLLVDNKRVDALEERWKCGAERNVFLFLVVCCPSPLVVALGSRSHSFSLLIWHWNSTAAFWELIPPVFNCFVPADIIKVQPSFLSLSLKQEKAWNHTFLMVTADYWKLKWWRFFYWLL